jgi:type I restriction enzyme S subunit
MKAEWSIKPLGEVCEFQRGLTYAKSEEVDFSSNVVLRATNIDLTTNLLDLEELKYISDSVYVGERKKVKRDSLLICTASGSKSHLGKVAYINDDYDYAFGGFMGMLTPSQLLLPRYFFHLMTSNAYKDFIAALSDGTNINNLKFSDLQHFPIPFPPLPEQQRIVAILDEAFESIAIAKANAEKNLQNAKALFDSYLQGVFSHGGEGWSIKILGDTSILKIIDGDRGSNYPNKEDFSDDGFCLFLNTKNVRPDGFNFDKTMFVSEEKDKSLRKGKLQRQDVILTTRGTIGNVAIFDESVEFENIRINSGMLIFRVNPEELLPSFLYEVFRSGIMKEQMTRYVSGAAQPQLPIKTLINFEIPIPNSLAAQGKIVDGVRAINHETQRLESIYQQKITALDELKKALLHQAFSGQL